MISSVGASYTTLKPRELLSALAAEEAELDFASFGLTDAWNVGAAIRDHALAHELAISVGVVLGAQRAFHVGMPGSAALNDAWLERKFRTVEHFGRSSLAVHYDYLVRGQTFAEGARLDPTTYADGGGGFPVRIGGTLAGAIGVSGLEMHADHALIVSALRSHVARPVPAVARPIHPG